MPIILQNITLQKLAESIVEGIKSLSLDKVVVQSRDQADMNLILV